MVEFCRYDAATAMGTRRDGDTPLVDMSPLLVLVEGAVPKGFVVSPKVVVSEGFPGAMVMEGLRDSCVLPSVGPTPFA